MKDVDAIFCLLFSFLNKYFSILRNLRIVICAADNFCLKIAEVVTSIFKLIAKNRQANHSFNGSSYHRQQVPVT